MEVRSQELRSRLDRLCMEFFERAERQRRWSLFSDIPWDQLSPSEGVDSPVARRLEAFCAIELYVPDYASQGIALVRASFGQAWFQIGWAYEESKHGLVLRELLRRAGLRSTEQLRALEDELAARPWTLPFDTPRQMTCYGALQEGVTHAIYRAERKQAAAEGDPVRERIFYFLARDEAAHAGFYHEVLEALLEDDRAGTIRDLAEVVRRFRMPGDGLLDDYRRRMSVPGASLGRGTFLRHVALPLLRRLGVSRRELFGSAGLQAVAAAP
jgi:acyl-[acyl-carrier-protein] desaturase